MLVNVAVPSGGRREIADAVRSLLQEHAALGTSLEELAELIDVEHIADHLYTRGQPDPDLVIRTSGEQRLGGFLLWQSGRIEVFLLLRGLLARLPPGRLPARLSAPTRSASVASAFQQQAYDLVTSDATRKAFDIGSEDAKLRDRYGRHQFGQSALLARRLVEAGSTFVTVHYGGWDHHWDLKAGMHNNLPMVDAAVSSLLTDLSDRGLLDKVLVMLCGEFSRTPRMNDGGNGGPPMSMGTPGRDHWGNAMFVLIGGGGVQGGRIVGSTDRLGEFPKDRPLTPGDLHATIYKVLGVDPTTHFLDRSGRPVAAIDSGTVIEELF